MDMRHPDDASSAVMGIITNLLQRGFRDRLFSLLILAARKQNATVVKARAMAATIFIASAYDEAVRGSEAVQEDLLDLIAEQPDTALFAICRIGMMRRHMIIMGNVKDIRKTLINRLIVVGEEANRMFDQSC